jgi:hypothetical protein
VCFKKALTKSLAIFIPKRSGLTSQETIPKYTPLPQYRTSKGDESVKTVCYSLYSPDIAPADLYLRRRMKSELTGIWLSQESSKTSWDRIVRNVTKNESAAAIRR